MMNDENKIQKNPEKKRKEWNTGWFAKLETFPCERRNAFQLFVFCLLFFLCFCSFCVFFSYFCQDDLPHQKLPPCEMRNALVFPTILLDSHLITFQWHDKDTHTKTKTKTKTGINAPSPQGPGVRGEMHFKFLTILLDSHPIREFFFSTNCQSISLLEQLLSIQYNVVNYTATLPIGNLPKRLLVPLWQVAFLSLIDENIYHFARFYQ